ncbi:Fc.00g069000.m01.CDS01 [Cosmosporella sp. VM-42]
MTRGETTQTKVHYKGNSDDFLVFIDDVETYKQWLSDKSIPMTHFVSSFQIFLTHKQGTQGTFDTASKSSLASEFDTESLDDAIKIILEKGTVSTSEMPGRQGTKNDSMGGTVAH